MKKYPAVLLLLAALLTALLPAQMIANPTGLPAAAALQVMSEALTLRTGLAEAVAHGTEKPAAALRRLQQAQSASGLPLPGRADFAYAAIDVGRRLIAAGKPAEAEKFFQAAELSLDVLVKKTPDTQASAKASYLQKRSLLRGSYLGKVTQAKQDIAQAVALQPQDQYLRRDQAALAGANAAVGGRTP